MSAPPSFLPLALLGVVCAVTVARIVELKVCAGVNAVVVEGGQGTKAQLERAFTLSFAGAALFAIAHALVPGLAKALGSISFLDSPLIAWTGATIALGSVLLVATAQITMGRSWRIGVSARERNALVSRGVYRISRNPIYVGMVGALAGVFLMVPDAVTLALLAVACLSISLQVRIEEEHLRRVHGDAFDGYCARTRRWL